MNWGVPDWRHGKYPSDLSALQWQWEFLRRRPDYRADWVKHFEPSWAKNRRRYDDNDKPPGLDSWDEVLNTYVECEYAQSKYGLGRLLDPSKPFDNEDLRLEFGFPGEPALIRSATPKFFEIQEAQNRIVFAFDLNSSAAEQFELARVIFEQEQCERIDSRAARRNHIAKWPLYLRVIDARDAGATFPTITSEVLGWHRSDSAPAYQIWEQAQAVMFKATA